MERIITAASSTLERSCAIVLITFSGCLHMRHPFEAGGLTFSLFLIWAQIIPFIALQYYDGDDNDDNLKEKVLLFLVGCLR